MFWTDILYDTLISLFFIEGNLNAETYKNMLRNQIVPAIRAIVGADIENTCSNRMVLQHTMEDIFVIA